MFEFKIQDARAFINDKGELKFEGKKGKKELKQLQPLFDAILKSDTKYNADKKKLDDSEKALMEKLHNLLMADGKIDAKELKLGSEFAGQTLSIEAFIDKKLAEIEPKDEVKKEEKKEENVDELIEVKEDPLADEIAKQNLADIEEQQKPKVEQKPDPRVSQNAFNQTIQNQKMKIQDKKDELAAAFTIEVPINKGVYLYNVAVQALKDEGVEHPTAKEINERIAQIALVNDINDVNKVPIGKVIKVGGAGSPVQPVGDSTFVETVAPSTIEIAEKSVVDTLTELGYTPGEDKTKDGITYKEWTKKDSATMYTTEVDGVTLGAAKFEDLKKLKENYEKATITAAPANEDDAAKTTRQTANLENMKKRIELSGGDLDVIKGIIDKLREDGIVNLESNEVQAFIQDLVKTKNVDVLTKLLVVDNKNFTNDLIKNEDTAKTVASLYKEIRDKEKAGIKLTDDEVALKDFMASKVQNNELYGISADADNGIAEKFIYFNERSGEIAYQSGEYYANDPKVLDNFVKAINQANAAKKDATIADDTDEKAKERALAAVFKQYVNTEDKMLANCIASNADVLHASKEDVLDLVAKSDMFVLSGLTYTPSTEDAPAFNKAVADRVVALYEAGNGDPANMRYLEQAFAKIDVATYDPETGKQEAKNKILDSFFEVTGEGENKTYAFKPGITKPSRRPTKEELSVLYNYSNEVQNTAIANAVKLDDMGPGQWAAVVEDAGVSKDCYAVLIKDMSAEDIVDFIKNKMQNKKDYNIPFDAIISKFPDNLAEQTELVAELLKNVSTNSVMEDANRVKLVSSIIDAEGNLKLPDEVQKANVIVALPADCSANAAKTCFDRVLATLGKENIGELKTLADRVTDETSKAAIKAKVEALVTENATDATLIKGVLEKFSAESSYVLQNIDASKLQPEDAAKDVKQKLFSLVKDSFTPETYAKALENKWGSAVHLSHIAYPEALGEYCNFNDVRYKVIKTEDKVTLEQVKLDGILCGAQMFKEVEGVGSGKIRKILNGEHDDYKITKDNVVDVIKSFQSQIIGRGKNTNEGIIRWLSDEWGPTKDEMNVIPKKLLEFALEKGVGENESVYANLKALLKEGAHSDYSADHADKIDAAMRSLIDRVEGRLEVTVPEGTPNAEAAQDIFDRGNSYLAQTVFNNIGTVGEVKTSKDGDGNVEHYFRCITFDDGTSIECRYDKTTNEISLIGIIFPEEKNNRNFDVYYTPDYANVDTDRDQEGLELSIKSGFDFEVIKSLLEKKLGKFTPPIES